LTIFSLAQFVTTQRKAVILHRARQERVMHSNLRSDTLLLLF
jgi:hypothetical protein